MSNLTSKETKIKGKNFPPKSAEVAKKDCCYINLSFSLFSLIVFEMFILSYLNNISSLRWAKEK